MCIHTLAQACKEVREQPAGLGSPLLPYGTQGSHSGLHGLVADIFLPGEPSCQPYFMSFSTVPHCLKMAAPCTQEAEVEQLQIGDQPGLPNTFQDSLNYKVKHCLKQNKTLN